MPAARMRADHSMARTLSSFAANDGTSASTRGIAEVALPDRAPRCGRHPPAPSCAARRSPRTSRSSGTRATNSVGSKSVSAHSRANASQTSGANGSASNAASTSARRGRRSSPSRYATWARAMRAAVDRAGNQRSVGSSTPSSSVRAASTSPSCRCAAASRRSPRSGRVAFSRTISAQTLDFPRPAARQAGSRRRTRRPKPRIAGSSALSAGDLEPVERLFVAELARDRCARGRTPRSPKASTSSCQPCALDRHARSIG